MPDFEDPASTPPYLPRYPPPPFAPPSRQRPIWPFVLAAVVVLAASAALIIGLTAGGRGHDNTANGGSPADPGVVHGDGWSMSVDPEWTDVDATKFGAGRAWLTGGFADQFANNVNVVVQPNVGMGMKAFIRLSE